MKSLESFLQAMQDKIMLRQEKYGDGWKTCDINNLNIGMYEEFGEYVESQDPDELIDIANMAYFIWARLNELEEDTADKAICPVCGSDLYIDANVIVRDQIRVSCNNCSYARIDDLEDSTL